MGLLDLVNHVSSNLGQNTKKKKKKNTIYYYSPICKAQVIHIHH